MSKKEEEDLSSSIRKKFSSSESRAEISLEQDKGAFDPTRLQREVKITLLLVVRLIQKCQKFRITQSSTIRESIEKS